MGNYVSKIFPFHGDNNEGKSKIQNTSSDENLDKTVCTPIIARKLVDPRSASSGIARTPIEISSIPGVPRYVASAIPKHLLTKQYLETDFDQVLPTGPLTRCIPDPRSPNIDHQRTPIVMKPTMTPIVTIDDSKNELRPDGNSIDPRSPTVNFDRTPIIKQKTSEHLPPDSLELKKDSTNVVITYCEVTSQLEVPEVQVLPEISTKKAVNLEGSLTFNRDVDETNPEVQVNSEVVMMKPVNLETRLNVSDDVDDSMDCCSSDESESEEQITVIPNLKSSKFNNNQAMNQSINEVLFENELDDDFNVETNVKETKSNKEIHGKIKVWRDSTSPQLTSEIPKQNGKNSQEIIIEFDDDTVITSLKSEIKKLPVKIEEQVKNIIENNQVGRGLKTKSWNKDVKIVRDDAKDVNDSMKNRTPLGNRSNNAKSGERGKSPHQILINKGLFTKQQENTPPASKRFKGKNLNGTTWDPDMSVII